ncbi:hypothetical protein ACP4OV_023865 [Aristida adscensionis]
MTALWPVDLLFETPCGFAVFFADGGLLKNCDSIWTNFVSDATPPFVMFREFQKFENKCDAISLVSSIDEQLSKLIRKWHSWDTLLVGNPMHKEVIEKYMGITCLYSDAVLELMRCMKRRLPALMPGGETHLSEDDRKDFSQGLTKFLQSYGFDIYPGLISVQIAEAACCVYHCAEMDKEILKCVNWNNYVERENINTEGWSGFKCVTALALMCTEEAEDGSDKIFSVEELDKIRGGKGKYDAHIIKDTFRLMYKKAARIHKVKLRKLEELRTLINLAKQGLEMGEP